MNTEKIDEIIKILRAIADTSTSNKIALLSVTEALICSFCSPVKSMT